MVVLETQLSELKKLVDKKLTVESLTDMLQQVGFDLDGVEKDTLKIDITPDRIDALSTIGLARILNNLKGKKPKKYTAKKSSYKVIVDKSVADVRPFTACAVISGCTFTDDSLKDIIWVQEKLHATIGKHRKKAAIGIYPMEHITWPITFCAKKSSEISFQPLESVKKMSAKDILEKHPTGQAYGELLKGLKMYPLFIDGANEVLSMPPIINSHKVGKVTLKTKSVFMECSGFDLKTVSDVMDILVALFIDMGCTAHQVTVAYKKPIITPVLAYKELKVESSYVKSIIGSQLTDSDIKKSLEKLGHTVSGKFTVSVPPYRKDVWHTVDLVDDVVRGFGINNLVTKKPMVATEGNILAINRWQDMLTDYLVGHGLNEIKTLGVTDKADQFTKMNLAEFDHVSLGSTAERAINMVRIWITPELLKFLSNNRSVPLPHAVFEFGEVVVPDSSADVLSRTVLQLGALLSEDKATFTNAKQLLESLLAVMNIKLQYKPLEHPSYISGRCAGLYFKNKLVGTVGEISPVVLTNWNIITPTAGFELQIEEILQLNK